MHCWKMISTCLMHLYIRVYFISHLELFIYNLLLNVSRLSERSWPINSFLYTSFHNWFNGQWSSPRIGWPRRHGSIMAWQIFPHYWVSVKGTSRRYQWFPITKGHECETLMFSFDFSLNKVTGGFPSQRQCGKHFHDVIMLTWYPCPHVRKTYVSSIRISFFSP